MNLSFLVCQKWYSEDLPQIAQTLARYGHTAVAKGRLVYLFLSQSSWSIILSCWVSPGQTWIWMSVFSALMMRYPCPVVKREHEFIIHASWLDIILPALLFNFWGVRPYLRACTFTKQALSYITDMCQNIRACMWSRQGYTYCHIAKTLIYSHQI